jgi:hypothetical protein
MRSHRSGRTQRRQHALDRQGQQCANKRRHPDEAAAWAEIDALRKAGKAGETRDWKLHAYGPCDKCGHWHVGHYMPKFEGGV